MTEQERLSKLEAEFNAFKQELAAHTTQPHVNPMPPVQPVIIPGTSGKRNYGFRPDLPDQRDYTFASLNKKVKLPAAVDLRPTCSPVEDQGQLGSCVGNACAGALEFIELKDKHPLARMSRLFIYYNARAIEHTVNYDSGCTIRDAVSTIVKQGCCPETDLPYNISQFTARPSAKCYSDALQHTAQSYYRINTLNDMQTCLASQNTFVFGISVYTSFESASAIKTGIVPLPGKKEKLLGGHALECCGYDNSKQWFIFKNSWGTSYGANGYGFLPYAYMTNPNLMSDAWCVATVRGL